MGMFDWLTNPIASIGSALIGGAVSSSGQSSANAANAEIAREQMAFQKQSVQDQMAFQREMSGTAYQRAMTDMKAAGINPMLAASQGGASTPGGASAGGASAVMQNTKAALGQALMSSAQVANLQAQTRKTNAEANITEQVGLDQARANLDRTLTDTGLSVVQINQVKANTDNLIAQLDNIKDENLKIKRAAELIYQQTNSEVAKQLTESQRYELTKAQVQQVLSATELNHLDISAAKALDNLGRTSAQLKPIIDIFRLLMRR